VIDTAEDIVIRAAYKALAQRYHPDKFKGEPGEAHRKMSELNEAYNILSSVVSRKNYDEEYYKFNSRDDVGQSEGETNFADFDIEGNKAWALALKFYPEIHNQFLELSKINSTLANTFKNDLIINQSFDKSIKIKNKYLNDHLSRYYGLDKKNQDAAKILLLNGCRNVALDLNEIIRHMGSSISHRQVMERLYKDHSEVMILKVMHFELRDIVLRAGRYSAISSELIQLMKFLYDTAVKKRPLLFSINFVFSYMGKEYDVSAEDFSVFVAKLLISKNLPQIFEV
jgi:hypothetical protein